MISFPIFANAWKIFQHFLVGIMLKQSVVVVVVPEEMILKVSVKNGLEECDTYRPRTIHVISQPNF